MKKLPLSQKQEAFTFPNGDKYVGGMNDDRKYGQGTFTHPDGTTESGIWKNDVLETKTN